MFIFPKDSHVEKKHGHHSVLSRLGAAAAALRPMMKYSVASFHHQRTLPARTHRRVLAADDDNGK